MYKKLVHQCKYIKEYGISIFILSNLCRVLTRFGIGLWWQKKILQKKHNSIIRYLFRYYTYATQLDKRNKDLESGAYHNCIWTAWLQGEENAPEVTQITLASIRRYSNGHSVIVLTNENINNYIMLPEEIVVKHKAGKINHAHYTDVIRMMIVAKYGGVWLDATILLHEPINETAFISPFFSMGYQCTDMSTNISNHKWIVGIIGGCKESDYLYIISKMLISYWMEHDIPIDYFVFDYLIALLYKENTSFSDIISHLTQMKYAPYEMRKSINAEYDPRAMKKFYISEQLYTLSYKYTYTKQRSNNITTIYGHLYEQFLK